jgi:hypothetical protein
MKKAEAYWPLILLLALIKFILPLFLQSSVYELQRDEFLYYEQGQHLALGYLENPPLLSYLGTISSWFGGSEAWIKLWPCLFGAATVVVTCLVTAELGGKLFAQFLAGLSVMTGAYMRVHFLFQPNILDVFFWTLAVYFIIRYINDRHPSFLYWFFISLALGFWGKYSVIFVAAAIIIALLLSRHRVVFTRKQFYFAALTGLLIILPNVWWQYQHNWPLFHHMKELQETQLKYMNPTGFLTDQVMMLIATTFVWLAGLIWLFRNKQWRFLGIAYLLVIALLILGRGKSYYSLGIYPMLFAAGAVAWEKWTERKYWIRYVHAALIIGFTWLIMPMLLPIWKPEKLEAFYKKVGEDHTWEDQKTHPLPQDFADMMGWKELTAKTEKFYTSLPDTVKNNTIVFGRHYGHAGAFKFYGKDKQFREKAMTDVGSFLLWIPDDLLLKNIVLIARRMPDKEDEVFQHFEKVTIIDSVTNTYSRQFGDKIIFFENIDSTGLRLAQEGLREMKKEFNR